MPPSSQDETLKAKCKAANDVGACVKLAEEHGYHFTDEQLKAELSKLSPEELSEIVNPGIAPRQHIDPQ